MGTGTDVTIAELASLIAKVVGFEGALEYDRSKPDGTPRKLMDVSKLAELGWRARTALEEGIRLAYADFRAAAEEISRRPVPPMRKTRKKRELERAECMVRS